MCPIFELRPYSCVTTVTRLRLRQNLVYDVVALATTLGVGLVLTGTPDATSIHIQTQK
eukprot:COSAG02_NODE_4616_length_5160_cov_2.446750_2_plen_58_part_00